MCNCIEEVQESVKEIHKYNAHFEVDCVLTNSKTGLKSTGQRIEISYNHVRKDGGVQRKYKKSFVSHNYCPFCGGAYP